MSSPVALFWDDGNIQQRRSKYLLRKEFRVYSVNDINKITSEDTVFVFFPLNIKSGKVFFQLYFTKSKVIQVLATPTPALKSENTIKQLLYGVIKLLVPKVDVVLTTSTEIGASYFVCRAKEIGLICSPDFSIQTSPIESANSLNYSTLLIDDNYFNSHDYRGFKITSDNCWNQFIQIIRKNSIALLLHPKSSYFTSWHGPVASKHALNDKTNCIVFDSTLILYLLYSRCKICLLNFAMTNPKLKYYSKQPNIWAKELGIPIQIFSNELNLKFYEVCEDRRNDLLSKYVGIDNVDLGTQYMKYFEF